MPNHMEKDVANVLERYQVEGIQGASERYCEISETRDFKRWEQLAFREACRKAMRDFDTAKGSN